MPIISRLVEKSFSTRLNYLLENFNLLNINEPGLVDALIFLTSIINAALDKVFKTAAGILDLIKAFDITDRDLLLE